MPTNNPYVDQATQEMLGKMTRDLPGSPGNRGHLPYLQYYSQPVTENGHPFTGLDMPLRAMGGPRDNVMPRTIIGATGITTPDMSHGELLSHFLPSVSIPYETPPDPKAALVKALMSGPTPANGKR